MNAEEPKSLEHSAIRLIGTALLAEPLGAVYSASTGKVSRSDCLPIGKEKREVVCVMDSAQRKI